MTGDPQATRRPADEAPGEIADIVLHSLGLVSNLARYQTSPRVHVVSGGKADP